MVYRPAIGNGPQLELESAELQFLSDKSQVLDPFQMTPFHVLLSSARCREDMLRQLLNYYPSYILACRDVLGNRAVDYLYCKRWTSAVKDMMNMTLEKHMVERVSNWGNQDLRMEISSTVSAILGEDDHDRRKHLLQRTYDAMDQYKRLEGISTLELVLWKSSMTSIMNERNDTVDQRSESRV